MITKSYNDITIEEFYNIFFQLFNVLQTDTNKLTKLQTKLLVEFLLLDDQVYKFTRFGYQGKRAVQQSYKAKYNKNMSLQRLHMFVILLKKRGIIYEDSDRVKYLTKGLRDVLDKAITSTDPVGFIFKMKILK